MSKHDPIDGDEMDFSDSWAISVTDQLERSRRTAWIIACVSAGVAVLLAIALVMLLPLKTVEPFTLLVDRQTGHVEALAPMDEQVIAADSALTRSFLVQYVIARESYDYDTLQSDYAKVALWSAGEARQRYMAMMRSTNPASPIAAYPQSTRVSVEVRSVSSLAQGRSLVRFTTTRSDRARSGGDVQHWAAVIDYGYSDAPMSEEDRYLNPLGFQVTRYRRDAETLPEVIEASEAAAQMQEQG